MPSIFVPNFFLLPKKKTTNETNKKRYLGDGPKLVRELFRVADEMSPTLVFIDEIDAVGSKRYDSNSGGTREIQRTMLELLNQLDGFDERGDVKVRCFRVNAGSTRGPSFVLWLRCAGAGGLYWF